MVAPDGSAPLSTSETMTLNSAQLTKLQRDLSIVEGNMTVLSEMLSELSPGQEHPTDLDLLRELYTTYRAMQQRLVKLIDRVADDRMTAHLLKINDDLNNLFLRLVWIGLKLNLLNKIIYLCRYDRYEKNRLAISRDQPNFQPQPRAAAAVEPPSLIDLDDLQPSAPAAALLYGYSSTDMEEDATLTPAMKEFLRKRNLFSL